MKTIHRAKKSGSYVQIDNCSIRDTRLSWKAKGLLAYLLSLPDDWRINGEHLATQGPDGISSVRSGLKELENAGYLHRKRIRTAEGKFRWDISLLETPKTGHGTDEPSSLQPLSDNLTSKEVPSTNDLSKNNTRVDTTVTLPQQIQDSSSSELQSILDAFIRGSQTSPSTEFQKKVWLAACSQLVKTYGATSKQVFLAADRQRREWTNPKYERSPKSLLGNWGKLHKETDGTERDHATGDTEDWMLLTRREFPEYDRDTAEAAARRKEAQELVDAGILPPL